VPAAKKVARYRRARQHSGPRAGADLAPSFCVGARCAIAASIVILFPPREHIVESWPPPQRTLVQANPPAGKTPLNPWGRVRRWRQNRVFGTHRRGSTGSSTRSSRTAKPQLARTSMSAKTSWRPRPHQADCAPPSSRVASSASALGEHGAGCGVHYRRSSRGGPSRVVRSPRAGADVVAIRTYCTAVSLV
jgi:hypothetical protein